MYAYTVLYSIYVCVFLHKCSPYSTYASICCRLLVIHMYCHVLSYMCIIYALLFTGEFRQAIVLIEKGLRLVRTREETQDLYQLYLMTKAQADALDVLQSTQ